jgi:hypothetical protein
MDLGWFEELFGFEERSPEFVREHLRIERTQLRSLANGRVFECGLLEIPTLALLREQAEAAGRSGETTLEEWIADAEGLHRDPRAAGAVVQVASQFNLLEMVHPSVTPEEGITGYVHDRTQGPACALAAAPGTVYRAHLCPVEGVPGQTRDRQIDCLAGLGQALGPADEPLWEMQNGYVMPSREQLAEIRRRLGALSSEAEDTVMAYLQIGLQHDTEVTLDGVEHRLTQAYCSALPVAYGEHVADEWEPFARLVLRGAYEATLAAGVANAARTGNPHVFLTLLGGGAFGNRTEWVFDAIEAALERHRHSGLEVVIISYQSSKPDAVDLIERFNGQSASRTTRF